MLGTPVNYWYDYFNVSVRFVYYTFIRLDGAGFTASLRLHTKPTPREHSLEAGRLVDGLGAVDVDTQNPTGNDLDGYILIIL